VAVTAELYTEYEAYKAPAVEFAKPTDITDAKMVIVPAAANITLGTPGNPAIYVNKESKEDKLDEKYRNPLRLYAQQHSGEVIRVDDIIISKCVLVAEMQPGSAADKLKAYAIIWHEYGHAYNERASIPNNEQTAYQFELKMLVAKMPDVLLPLGIRESDLRSYLKSRYGQYTTQPAEATLKLFDGMVTRLCHAILKDAVPPPSAPALAIPLNSKLFMETAFGLKLITNLQAIKSKRLCAFICGPSGQMDKGRSGTLLMLSSMVDDNGCNQLSIAKTMPTSPTSEVRFYENV